MHSLRYVNCQVIETQCDCVLHGCLIVLSKQIIDFRTRGIYKGHSSRVQDQINPPVLTHVHLGGGRVQNGDD